MIDLLVAACGLAFGLGVIGLASTFRAAPSAESSGRTAPDVRPGGHTSDVGGRRGLFGWRPSPIRVAAAMTCGLVAGVATGWIVAVPIGVVAGLGLPALLGRTSGGQVIARIEAVAIWTEMLQSTLAASAGLSQAIVATADLAPLPIRPATRLLASRLEAGAQPRDALLSFAEDVADPCADRVVCALLLSYESRGQRLGDVLASLADSTRDEVALRLRIETSRASVRSSVRTVLIFSVSFAVGLAILAHSYLSPFGTAAGQLVLLVVALLYGVGLFAMVAIARPPAPIRLLGTGVATV